MGSGAAHAVAVVADVAKASDSSPTGSSMSSKDSSALYKACNFEQEDEVDEEGVRHKRRKENQPSIVISVAKKFVRRKVRDPTMIWFNIIRRRTSLLRNW
jgi:hypothetical protein